MSQYKKTATELELLVAKFDTLQASPNADNVAQGTAIEEVHQALQAMEPTVQKMAASAQEVDPDKKIYGPAMATKVLALCDQYTTLLTKVQAALDMLNDALLPHKEAQEREKARLVAAEAAAKKRAEEEREHALRVKAEEERQRLKRLEEAKLAEQTQALESEAAEEAERQVYLKQKAITDAAMACALAGDLKGCVEIFEKHCPSREDYRIGLQTLQRLTSNLQTELSDPRFRHVRKKNENIDRELVKHVAGQECIIALGFREKELIHPTQETYFVLPEPDISDVEAYLAQEDHITRCHNFLAYCLSRQ